MTTDPTNEKVTARIIFKGVMLTCITRDKRCEVGMIRCPNHDPKITIKEVKSGAQTTHYELPWPAGHDLIFKVNKAEADEVAPHPDATGDTDFKKVIDLEGPDLHNGQVTVNTHSFDGRRLGVTSGKLYTHKLSEDELDLLTWTNANDPGTFVKTLGKIAQEVGLNIVCRDEQGSGIDIVDTVTGNAIKSLPSRADTWYEIDVNNDCRRAADATAKQPPTPAPTLGTDFRFFYDVIGSRNGRKFDLRVRVNPPAPPAPFPDICNDGFLSQTKTVGLTWPQL